MLRTFMNKLDTVQVRARGFSIFRFENPKSHSTEKLTLKLYIGRKLCEICGGKSQRYTRNKNVITDFENVTSELLKRFIRIEVSVRC